MDEEKRREFQLFHAHHPTPAGAGEKRILHRRRHRAAGCERGWRSIPAIALAIREAGARLVTAALAILPRCRRAAFEIVEHLLIEIAAIVIGDFGVADGVHDLGEIALEA